jgi:hypothetical protein
MQSFLFLALLAWSGGDAANPALLMKPAVLNIGRTCRWEARCMGRQERAMKRALSYVRNRRPPAWKVQTCNRNASRGRAKVDWIGFNNCIRNPLVKPTARRRTR